MSYLYNRIRHLHDRFFNLVNYLQSPFLLFVRVYWGWQLAQSGWGKLHHLSNVADFFVSLNLPYPSQTALFVSCVEFFGGILLAFGFLSRMTALILTINMLVAYVTADREALLAVFSDPDKFYAAAPYTFLVASVIILLVGPGKLALDSALRCFLGEPSPQQTSAMSR
jgi:putative oxidoreductase